jgi:hypothetical protein
MSRILLLSTLIGCLASSASTCLAQQANWFQAQPSTSPSARAWHKTAFDLIRQRTVLFGGSSNGSATGLLGDTWEWDGNNWTQMKPTASPPARWAQGMAFDILRRRSVIFGGQTPSATFAADTWEWDGKTWTQMNPTKSPSARHTVMVYDFLRARIVLFGGRSAAGYMADTWEYDGKTWTQVTPTTSPPARGYHAMAYDLARRRTVVFGGLGGTLADTWEYDGKTWTQIKTLSAPSARYYAGMAYDTARQRIVLFGGRGTSTALTDTWEYDGKNWTQIKPTTLPPGRSGVGMAYDSVRQRTVMHGGWGTAALADTWEYGVTMPLSASPSTISIATGGTHAFTLDAGVPNANRLYWIFGSITGTSPGVTLLSAVGSVTIPLVPDPWTSITIASANTTILSKTRGALDGSGKGSASFNVPSTTISAAIGVKFYHAFLAYDANSNYYLASNPVTLTLVQ